MWFTFVTARLFISLRFQPRLTATLERSISVVNSPIRRTGLSPVFRPTSLAQTSLFSVECLSVPEGPLTIAQCFNIGFERELARVPKERLEFNPTKQNMDVIRNTSDFDGFHCVLSCNPAEKGP